MTTAEKLIKNKLGLLQLASYLQNVSEACRVMGYSRDTFYKYTALTHLRALLPSPAGLKYFRQHGEFHSLMVDLRAANSSRLART